MVLFNYIIILLSIVLISNLIYRFVPYLSPTILQIGFGMIVALFATHRANYVFQLDPSLFSALFIAPIIYFKGMNFDKSMMKRLIKPIIIDSSLIIVITLLLTVTICYFFIPHFSFTALLILVGALCATDGISVAASSSQFVLGKKKAAFLSAESVINGAVSIVVFQAALIFADTKEFYLFASIKHLIMLVIGGVFIGIGLNFLKYRFTNWLKSIGMVQISLHLLIDLLMPFVTFLFAKAMDTSAVHAVFAAGFSHLFFSNRYSPEQVQQNITFKNIADTLSFTLQGLVFVLFGTQLPVLFSILMSRGQDIPVIETVALILLISISIYVARFLWWKFSLVSILSQSYGKKNENKEGMVFAFLGARGMVTFANALAMPLFLPGGTTRNDHIVVITGVILISLLVSNFVLPIFTEIKHLSQDIAYKNKIYSEVITKTVEYLQTTIPETYKGELALVIRNYYHRLSASKKFNEKESRLFYETLQWQIENTKNLIAQKVIHRDLGEEFITNMNERMMIFDPENNRKHKMQHLKNLHHRKIHHSEIEIEELNELQALNNAYVIDRLKELNEHAKDETVSKIISFYDMMSHSHTRHPHNNGEIDQTSFLSIFKKGIQIERAIIQQMYESSQINHSLAKELRENLLLLEARLQDDF